MGTFVHGLSSPASGTEPFDRIMVESPFGSKFFTAHDDAGSLVAGLLVYRTAGTQLNDMSVTVTNFGDIAQQGKIYVVELTGSDIHMAINLDLTTAYSANDPILIREIRKGDRLWLKGGGSLTVAEDEFLIAEGSGLVANTGDPNGTALEFVGHAFVILGSLSSGTWCLGEYIGIVAYDDT